MNMNDKIKKIFSFHLFLWKNKKTYCIMLLCRIGEE